MRPRCNESVDFRTVSSFAYKDLLTWQCTGDYVAPLRSSYVLCEYALFVWVHGSQPAIIFGRDIAGGCVRDEKRSLRDEKRIFRK